MTLVSFSVAADKCRFSNLLIGHFAANVPDCSEKLCAHTIVCGEEVKRVVCRSKNGVCDGYSADGCNVGHDNIAEEARFVRTLSSDFDEQGRRPVEGPGGR